MGYGFVNTPLLQKYVSTEYTKLMAFVGGLIAIYFFSTIALSCQ